MLRPPDSEESRISQAKRAGTDNRSELVRKLVRGVGFEPTKAYATGFLLRAGS